MGDGETSDGPPGDPPGTPREPPGNPPGTRERDPGRIFERIPANYSANQARHSIPISEPRDVRSLAPLYPNTELNPAYSPRLPRPELGIFNAKHFPDPGSDSSTRKTRPAQARNLQRKTLPRPGLGLFDTENPPDPSSRVQSPTPLTRARNLQGIRRRRNEKLLSTLAKRKEVVRSGQTKRGCPLRPNGAWVREVFCAEDLELGSGESVFCLETAHTFLASPLLSSCSRQFSGSVRRQSFRGERATREPDFLWQLPSCIPTVCIPAEAILPCYIQGPSVVAGLSGG